MEFKIYVHHFSNEDKDGIERKREFTQDLIEFYPGIPQSKIVSDTDDNIKDKYINLYNKYIDAGKARFEINISALSRKQLVKQYHRLNNQRLIKKEREELITKREQQNIEDESRSYPRSRSQASCSGSRFDYDRIQNDEIYSIIKSFDGALRDVIKCLNDSYSRFHVTKIYKNWHKKYVLDYQKQLNLNHSNKNHTHSLNNSSILKLKTSPPIDENMEDDDEKYNGYNSDNNDDTQLRIEK